MHLLSKGHLVKREGLRWSEDAQVVDFGRDSKSPELSDSLAPSPAHAAAADTYDHTTSSELQLYQYSIAAAVAFAYTSTFVASCKP